MGGRKLEVTMAFDREEFNPYETIRGCPDCRRNVLKRINKNVGIINQLFVNTLKFSLTVQGFVELIPTKVQSFFSSFYFIFFFFKQEYPYSMTFGFLRSIVLYIYFYILCYS